MEQGSHEFLVFQAIPPEGLPQSEIKVQGCMWSWNIKDDFFISVYDILFLVIIIHALAYSCQYVTLAKKWGYEEKVKS